LKRHKAPELRGSVTTRAVVLIVGLFVFAVGSSALRGAPVCRRDVLNRDRKAHGALVRRGNIAVPSL
jgi:hypothetical protein